MSFTKDESIVEYAHYFQLRERLEIIQYDITVTVGRTAGFDKECDRVLKRLDRLLEGFREQILE